MSLFSASELRERLGRIQAAWSADNYRALLHFFVRVLPSVMSCERCSIFVLDRLTGNIQSTAGTGLKEGDIIAPKKDSIVGQVIESGEICLDNRVQSRAGFHREAAKKTGFVSRHILCVPIRSMLDQTVLGAVQVINHLDDEGFGAHHQKLLLEVADYLGMLLENVLLSKDVLRLSQQLQQEISVLRSEGRANFIAVSMAMQSVIKQIEVVAPLPVSVMIGGENGTGKEQLARRLHDLSPRAAKPFVAINCAAIPENLVESELFGYEKGAFTGAQAHRAGRFEDVQGGTLFLDEIGDLPLHVQPKLLRVLQELEGSRLGSNKVIRYNFRLVCATNKDLRSEVANGRFREDLFYRLFAVEVRLPPLRERPEDIFPLLQAFLAETSDRFGRPLPSLEPDLLLAFEQYHWPGNVRQLRREVERLVALSQEGMPLSRNMLSGDLIASPGVKQSSSGQLATRVEALERQMIAEALSMCKGNKVATAKQLGITRQGLYNFMKRYQIKYHE